MTLIVEALPEHPLAAEIVLHVRKHSRRAMRRGELTNTTLSLLFGLHPDVGEKLGFAEALRDADVEQAAAERIAQSCTPVAAVVPLGHADDHVVACVEWLLERKRTERAFDPIIATDPASLLVLSKAIDLATARAPADPERRALPLVIQGETGTGKELLAQALHDIWQRTTGATGGFHPLHVAGLPKDQINDELFGHARGAYTDAKNDRVGRIEEADGGTLFIDEVGDLPADAQVRLLRFLQDGSFSRLGENSVRRANVRVLAATWHDLDEEVAAGRFRRDLLHRLRGDLLVLPRLHDRLAWAVEIVPQLLQRLGHTAIPPISASATDALSRAGWSGNLRELDAVLRGAVASSARATIRVEDLPSRIQSPYLALALHEKAAAFLCDEYDGKPLTERVVAWRTEEVHRTLERVPAPEPPAGLAALREFHAGIPDPSPEHQAAVQGIESYIAAAGEERRLREVIVVWEAVLADEPADLVVAAARVRLAHARSRHESALATAKRAEAAFTMSPWYKFSMEIAALPAFRKQHAVTIAEGVSFAVGLLYTIEPEWTKKLAAVVREGGLAAVRAKLKDLLEQASETEVIDAPLEATPDHRVLTREQWRELRDAHRSKAALARHLGIDPGTVSSYLKKHGLGRKASRSGSARRGKSRGE